MISGCCPIGRRNYLTEGTHHSGRGGAYYGWIHGWIVDQSPPERSPYLPGHPRQTRKLLRSQGRNVFRGRRWRVRRKEGKKLEEEGEWKWRKKISEVIDVCAAWWMMATVVDTVIYGVPGFNSWKLGRLMEWRFIDRFTFCVRLIPIVKGNVREYLTIFNITILISY